MIYLDHNATSPLLPEVLEAMQPWLRGPCNPSSVHQAGQRAMVAVERARHQVAALVGGRAEGVVFTSGATEANHTWFHAMREAGRADHIAVGSTEHPCVLAAAAHSETVHLFDMDRHGQPDLSVLTDRHPQGVSLMAANHETGVVHPVSECAGHGWMHIDATAAAGRQALDLGWADAVVLSAHKIGGPMGVGALVLKDGDPLHALLQGGSQERGRRAGTVNTPGVVGFGHAAALALDELEIRRSRWAALREPIVAKVKALGGRIVGQRTLPSVINMNFDGLVAETLVQALDLQGIAVSAGAACASGSVDASPVLMAMGDPNPAGGTRISMGPRTTEAEVAVLVERLEPVVNALRGVF